MTATTPANNSAVQTPFGFSYYPDRMTGQPVYFRPGDPRVQYQPPWKGFSTSPRGDYWEDSRSADEKHADRLAAEAASAQQKLEWQRERDAHKRVENWRNLFHTREELEKLPALSFA